MRVRAKAVMGIIFGVVRVAGPVVTAVLGVRAGKKLEDIESDGVFDGDVWEHWDNLDKKAKIKAALPVLAPVAISAGVTVVCGCVDKHFDRSYIKELSKTCSLAIASSVAYQQKLKEINPEAEQEVTAEIVEKQEKLEKKSEKKPSEEIVETGLSRGDTLFIDSLVGRKFYSNKGEVEAAFKRIENEYQKGGWFSEVPEEASEAIDYTNSPRCLDLNSVYHEFGISSTLFGQEWGWYDDWDKDNNDWNYGDGKIGLYLEPAYDMPNTYYIMYETAPFQGYYEL